ncbi:MAG: DUF4458 domain-containing protein [Alistipes sp.]|nr:DUF4458 domain-containing protein [Alistipes sp.]
MKNRVIHLWGVMLAIAATMLCSCEKQSESLDAEYGYVQFRIMKEAQMDLSRATDALEWLSEASKITVVLQHEGSTISQTLPLSSYDKQSAEWGLQSEKLRLMTGTYNIIGYKIYDNLDNEILSGDNDGEFRIVAGGLEIKKIGIPVVERGIVGFALQKAFPATRYEAEGNYPFSSIASIDITVKNKFTNVSTTFEAMPTTYYETFVEGSYDEELYERNGRSAYMICQSQYWLEAGNYVVTSYTTYSDSKGKSRLETATIGDLKTEFSIKDNENTMATVPIILSTTSERIKDYEALHDIWMALDGPNWTFHGEEYLEGANWDFNKDIDMWGEQPGVTLNGEGRIVGLNIAGFGAKGFVPEAIGQLTELQTVYFGNHNELIGGYIDSDNGRISALDYHERVIKSDVRRSLSPELQRVIMSSEERDALYRAERKDVAFGNLTNGITGISRAIMRLTKLEQFFIANAPITADGFFVAVDKESSYYAEQDEWSWSNFELLMDVEIYNCPNLERLPIDFIANLPKIQSLNVAMNYGISGEQLKNDWEAIIDGDAGDEIQILYLSYNNLRETPSHEYMKRMTRLSYLDCTTNKLEKVYALGKEISPASVLLDYNQISEIVVPEGGYFCGMSMLETFSCSNNRLTKLPDLFSARSIYTMLTADFSSNNISELENGDEWRGINTGTLNLANNRLTTLPERIFESGSIVEVLMLSANGMRTIEEGALVGVHSDALTTIDLSFNRLTELPKADLSVNNLPYLYGIDLSNNALTEFPRELLEIETLTVISIRQQRDDSGNRTFSDWPTGIGEHPKMAALYMGSNDLGVIDDVISPYILLFEIKDNPNISIDVSNVCPYIEKGYYELIYDSTQNIRGCDALNLD